MKFFYTYYFHELWIKSVEKYTTKLNTSQFARIVGRKGNFVLIKIKNLVNV